MSVSGTRAAEEINLDEFEKRLRAAGALQTNAEDPLSELSRILEASRVGPSAKAPAAQAVVADPVEMETGDSQSVEFGEMRPAFDEGHDPVPEDDELGAQAPQTYQSDSPAAPHIETGPETPEEPRPRAWKLKVSALALAGVVMIGGVVALKGGVLPGLRKQPPFIAAAQGPTKVQPPSDETVTAANDVGTSLLKDNAKPAAIKVVNSEEQPVDLSAQASLNAPPPAAAANPPPSADDAKPAAGLSAAAPLAATVNTPLVPPPVAAAPPPMASQFPDPKPVRTVSLRPDGTPIATPLPASPDAVVGPTQSAPPTQPAKPAPKANDAAGAAQPSTPKLDLPTKLSGKSSARVVVAKTETTAPDAGAQTPGEPVQAGTPPKPEKAPKKPKAAAVADTSGTAAPVDAAPATASGGWAVQLAAPKSEAEAKTALDRLNGKYGADLNGSTIGVHKAVVNGETIYRLRVVGLTKADAAALCARLKGEGGECFIAK